MAKPYPLLNWIQLGALIGADLSEALSLLADLDQQDEHIDRNNFWAWAVEGDRLLTDLVLSHAEPEVARRAPTPTVADIAEAYGQAFGLRSTWRERASVLDHVLDLHDLSDLANDGQALRAELAALTTALEHEVMRRVGQEQ